MKLNQTAAFRFGVGVFIVAAPLLAFVAGSRHNATTVAAAQATNRAPARPPVVDEYYPVKSDWIGDDRSIVTIKHGPTASCYVLVYPSGDVLLPVEKERCATSAAVEK